MRRLSLLLALLVPACGWFEKEAAEFVQQHVDEFVPPSILPHVAPAPAPAQADGLAPPVTLKDGQFVGPDGKPQSLHGFSYFGFNTPGRGGFDGLPWGNDPIANDFMRTLHRQRLLGFNAVRIPFSFAELPKEPPSFEHDCADVSDVDIARSTISPDVKDADPTLAPKLAFDLKRSPGKCNTLQTATVRARLMEAVEAYVKNGFYVLLDNHYREDQTAGTDPRGWAEGWKQIAEELLTKPEYQGRVFFDLLNEPGQYGQSWEKTDKDGIHALYIRAMDAVWQVSDRAIFFIEGTAQETLGANWGDGFCADGGKIEKMGLGDPRPFFKELAGKPYRNSVALAPHCYGPAVTYAKDNFSGPALFSRLSDSFGSLNRDGVAGVSPPMRLPVAVGEFGSHFKDQSDVTFMQDFAAYLTHQGAGKDDRHDPINAWFYWCWNADSGDTGGIVQDDWKQIEWVKIAYLETLGLTPWYRQKATPAVPSASAPSGAPTPTAASPAPAPTSASSSKASTSAPPAPGPRAAASSPTSPPPPPTGSGKQTSTPSSGGAAPAGSPAPPVAPGALPDPMKMAGLPPVTPVNIPAHPLTPEASPISSPQPSRPSTPPATKGPVATPSTPPKDGHIHGRVHIDSTWDGGVGEKFFAYQIHLVNMGDKRIVPAYDLRIEGPEFTGLWQSWNMDEAKAENGAVTGRVTAGWAVLEPGGKSEVVIGLVAKAKSEGGEIHSVKVSGAEVSLDPEPKA